MCNKEVPESASPLTAEVPVGQLDGRRRGRREGRREGRGGTGGMEEAWELGEVGSWGGERRGEERRTVESRDSCDPVPMASTRRRHHSSSKGNHNAPPTNGDAESTQKWRSHTRHEGSMQEPSQTPLSSAPPAAVGMGRLEKLSVLLSFQAAVLAVIMDWALSG